MNACTDGVPLREIYREAGALSAPPNSPSGSLDGDYARCMVKYLSDIAKLPRTGEYMFRFYLHDPWFMASAWRHYYNREPYDIFLPLSVSRLNEHGEPHHASGLHILTVDESTGEIPDEPAAEVIGHIRDFTGRLADAPGPVVWLYPFDEYQDLVEKGEGLDEIFCGDSLIRGAVDQGFPLSSVISPDNFLSALRETPERFDGAILLAPTLLLEDPAVREALERHLGHSSDAILYGPARGDAAQAFLGLGCAAPLEGVMRLSVSEKAVEHTPLLSGGPLDRISRDPAHNTVLAEYLQGTGSRPALMRRRTDDPAGGTLFWIRGTNSFRMKPNAYAPEPLDKETFAYPETLFRTAMENLGWVCRTHSRTRDSRMPVLTYRRCRNALFLAGYGRDTTSLMSLRFPDGAPLPCGSTVFLRDGESFLNTRTTLDLECRIFVISGGGDGLIVCRPFGPGLPEVRRRILVKGLVHADVLFRPEPVPGETVRFHNAENAGAPLARPDDYRTECGEDSSGPFRIIRDVSDELFITAGTIPQ